MTVTLASYQTSAMATNATGPGTHGLSADLLHAVLGIADEANELLAATSQGNLIEEMGDLLWFVALAAESMGLRIFEQKRLPSKAATPFDIMKSALILSGLIKKPFAYGKALPDEAIERELHNVITAVEALAERVGIPMTDVMELNLLKLKMRFPGRFNENDAINRNLAHERALFASWYMALPVIRQSAMWFLCRGFDEYQVAQDAIKSTYTVNEDDTVLVESAALDMDGLALVYITKESLKESN